MSTEVMNSLQGEKKGKMFSHLSPRQKEEQNKRQNIFWAVNLSSNRSSDSSCTSLRSMEMSKGGWLLTWIETQSLFPHGHLQVVSCQQIVRDSLSCRGLKDHSSLLVFSGIKANGNPMGDISFVQRFYFSLKILTNIKENMADFHDSLSRNEWFYSV